MQVVTNENYVRGKLRRGNVAHVASLALLAVGFVISLLTEPLGRESIFFAYAALIVAMVLLSYGRTFTRRFGPRFRQDQWLTPALRGLDNRHTLYNYAGPDRPDHILVGPTGLYILVPMPQSGTIRFDGRRWSRGSLAGGFLRNLSEGGLGNPIAEVRRAVEQLALYLRKHAQPALLEGLKSRNIIVFTNPGARLEIQDAPEGVSVMHLRELRTIFRRTKATMEPEKMEGLKALLGQEVQS